MILDVRAVVARQPSKCFWSRQVILESVKVMKKVYVKFQGDIKDGCMLRKHTSHKETRQSFEKWCKVETKVKYIKKDDRVRVS